MLHKSILFRFLDCHRNGHFNSTSTITKSINTCLHRRLSYSAADESKILEDLLIGKLSHHKLESLTSGSTIDAVKLRRKYIQMVTSKNPSASNADKFDIPVDSIDGNSYYNQVNGANCENVIGFIPIPVGVAGPIQVDGKNYYVPMATTEGALIASTNRGARAISKSGGATTVLLQDGMTRAPALECENLSHAAKVKEWIENPQNFKLLQEAFSSTTRFGRLEDVSVKLVGRLIFLRVKCFTGDAMGMNMIGKGSNEVVGTILRYFPTVQLKTLSGNYCTDKKPAAVNWIEGRGKSVAAEAVIHRDIVKSVLKTNVDAMIQVNIAKNLVGSAIAGSIGGNNAHSANMLTAVYLATGQDPAQNVESSNCITLMEKTTEGDLRISVTMPCVEVGTVGGGTSLPAQKAALGLLGIAGAHPTTPGNNARQLARLVAATVLAGELSLMAALSVNHLVSAHMSLNRKHEPTSTHSATTTTAKVLSTNMEKSNEYDIKKYQQLMNYLDAQENMKRSELTSMESVSDKGFIAHRCPVP